MKLLRALLIVFALCAPAPAFAQDFEVGQVWSLQAPMDANARIRIGRIEDNGQTIHISLWGQPVEPIEGALSSPLVAGHLPISADALRSSVNALVDEAPLEGLMFEDGYGQWRDARGGVFTITVAEIVVSLIETISTGNMTPVK
jgi:hypothetical protein